MKENRSSGRVPGTNYAGDATNGVHRNADARGLWVLRVLAIVIALASWLFFSFLPRLEERSEPLVSSEVVAVAGYEEPEGYMILNRENSVTVRVHGRSEQMGALTPAEVRLQVPFPERFTANEPVEVQLVRGS